MRMRYLKGKRRRSQRKSSSLRGLISIQDHFGNLDEFDHIQDLLSITSSEVIVATP